MALTPEQAKAMLDSLFAMPDKGKGKKAPAKTKPAATQTPVRKPHPRTILGLTSAGFLPALKIITVMHQHCDTCGGDHEYALPAVVRFEGKNASAREIPAAVEAILPVTIKDEWQHTQYCPQCVRLSRNLEDLMTLREGGIQLELFA
jgi:hypothetical protein